MAKPTIPDKVWHDRIVSAERHHKEWEDEFRCDILELYYEGKQWKNQETDSGLKQYVINKIYETIEIKLAEFVPTFPKFTVASKPANAEFNLQAAMNSAQLKQDMLQTIIDNDLLHFSEELEAAYKDSFFRFGLLEVGYAADWVLNPHVQKPLIKSDTDPQSNRSNKSGLANEPEELPVNERVYVKHIPAKKFRVGGIDNRYLDRCGWCGYYEFIRKEHLLGLPGLLNKDKIQSATGIEQATDVVIQDGNGSISIQRSSVLKIWHIWDLQARKRYIIVDDPCTVVYERAFKRLPIFDYRPHKRVKKESFYPIPPVSHWISPQDELNEIRDARRNHRRRFKRKFQVLEGQIDDIELMKFESGPDGALIKIKSPNGEIKAIDSPNMTIENDKAEMTAMDDLNRISGTSSEMRGTADRTTATQANIINQRSNVRENSDRDRISRWLGRVGREILLVCREKFALGMWVKMTSNEGENFLGAVQDHPEVYNFVSSEDLNDGYDFRIDVDVTSMSSNAQEEEKKKFLEFLAIITQYPAIAFSPLLVREAAFRVGYRNNAAIRELQKMALMMEQARMMGMEMQLGNLAQQTVAQQTPNTGEQIRQQMSNQFGIQ